LLQLGKAPAGLVLAGGLSSRMGKEKALLELQSKPLISWAYAAAANFATHIYVSVHDTQTAERYKLLLPSGATFITDLHEEPRSALLALLSSFSHITEEIVAVTPVDSPFVNKGVMVKIAQEAKNFDAVIPMWPDGKLEAIHAAYKRKNILPILQDLWSKETLELREITRLSKATLFISTESLSESDSALLSLLDADTPKEFKTLETVAASQPFTFPPTV
jgi:molybdopterin-guanine dinucleotide biosynthesis protein A